MNLGDTLLFAAGTVPIWSKPLAFSIGLGLWAFLDMVYVAVMGVR